MIPTSKLANIRTVVAHANCADGTASAILCKDALSSLGNTLEIVFHQYGTEGYKKFEPKPGVLFIDIAPYVETEEVLVDGAKVRQQTAKGTETLQAWIDAGTLVLDHHKGVENIVKAFGPNGVFADEKVNRGVCGTVLAYDHVWKPLRENLAIQDVFARRFARLAGIRDTYIRESPEWREACIQAKILEFFPNEWWLAQSFTEIASRWNSEFQTVGEVLLKKQEKTTQKLAENSYRFVSNKGTRVAVFDGHGNTTDVNDYLQGQVDLVVGFGYKCEPDEGIIAPKLIVSTRSMGYNCAKFCARYGGNGHTKAAGFSRPVTVGSDSEPFSYIQTLLNQYESE